MNQNDQLTFEDAVVKFFNSSEIEDKTVSRKGFESLTDKKDCNLNYHDVIKIE